MEVVPGDDVPPAREHVCVPSPLHGVLDAVVRTAMQQHEHRIPLGGIEAGWMHHPHLDGCAAAACVSDALHLAERYARERRIVEIGEARRNAVREAEPHQRRRFGEALPQGHRGRPRTGIARYREAAEARRRGDGPGLAGRCKIEAIDAIGRGIVDRAEERL